MPAPSLAQFRDESRAPGDLDQIADMYLVLDSDLRCTSGNRSFFSFTAIAPSQLTGARLSDVVGEDAAVLVSALTRLEDGAQIASLLAAVHTPNGKVWCDWSARRAQGRIYCLFRDAGERVWRDRINQGEQKILNRVVAGEPLKAILTLACLEFEEIVPGSLCSILLVDPTETKLIPGAAPSLPEAYTARVKGLPIGPNVGSCGSAIARRETVITEDIERDPKWDVARAAARAHNLASCWSIPLLDEPRRPLGSFAVYHRAPHRPPEREMDVARVFSNAVTLAIKRQADRDALIGAHQLAVEANNAKSDFLAQMSHELRTPLNAIIGFSDAMRSRLFGPLGAQQYERYAEHILQSGKMLAGLIDGLLDLARLESGPQELSEEDIDLAALIRECVRLFAEPHRAATILHDGVADSLMVRGDRQALMRVMLNLLGNAVKFTPADGEIVVRAARGASGIAIDVADNGEGIAEEGLAQIGRPFVRIRSQGQASRQGTGLGLFISRSLIEQHGGTLSVTSSRGKGTTVTIWLPHGRLTETAG